MERDEDTPINKNYFGKSKKTFQYLATISVCFAALSAGTVLAWSSPAITELAASKPFNSTFDEHERNTTQGTIQLTKKEEALLGSTVNLGALIYAIPTGYIADKCGRKVAIYFSAFTFLIGWVFVIMAHNVIMLLVARFFGGMGVGAICVAAPMYIGEIAENSMRATLSSYFQLFFGTGIFITFVIGAITDYVTMSAILAIFPIILFVTFPFMPESHVHLIKIGRLKAAEDSLIRYRGTKQDYDIEGEMEIISEEIKQSTNKSSSIGDILSKKSNINAIIAVFGMLSFQQLCGINAITFYTEQIFAVAGGIDPSIGAIIMGALQILGGYIGMIFIERAGRKYFLILSSIGMMIGLFVLAVFFHLKYLELKILLHLRFVPIVCAALFILAFTLAYGSIPYMMMHELLSPEIRGIGSGMAIVVSWATSFMVTYIFPLAMLTLGNYLTFYILTSINALAIVFVIFFVPETRGKTLIEIQQLLKRRK